MKALARRFSAIEDDGPTHGKFTLRLLPTPIHHYTDPASDHLDGAIFGFATGTNPDLLLVIESTQAPGISSPSWSYGFARIGGADLSGRLDGAHRLARGRRPGTVETRDLRELHRAKGRFEALIKEAGRVGTRPKPCEKSSRVIYSATSSRKAKLRWAGPGV